MEVSIQKGPLSYVRRPREKHVAWSIAWLLSLTWLEVLHNTASINSLAYTILCLNYFSSI